MKKFQLTWVDSVDATYPDIKSDGDQKSYEFEVESKQDAEKFVNSFMQINPEHDFSRRDLREVQ